jgi:hypothetical protein
MNLAEHRRPGMVVDVMLRPGVAHAIPMAMLPNTHVAATPASIILTDFGFLARLINGPSVSIINMVSLQWSALEWRDIAAGAQTERRERCRACEELT